MDVSFITGPPKLIVTVGIPGAGKTTWVDQHLPSSVVRGRPEGIRHRVYGSTPQRLEDEKEAEVWRRAEHEAAEASEGSSYVRREYAAIEEGCLNQDSRVLLPVNVKSH